MRSDHIASAAVSMDYRPAFVPFLDDLRSRVGGLDLFDAHTHIGHNDPDGFAQGAPQLLAQLEACDARALTFPMHEPGGYLDGAPTTRSSTPRTSTPTGWSAFCRVDPNAGRSPRRRGCAARSTPAPAASSCTRAARRSRSGHPIVERPRRRSRTSTPLPVLIHAGRGIPALGRDTVRLARAYPARS